jgi:hypothetical protein
MIRGGPIHSHCSKVWNKNFTCFQKLHAIIEWRLINLKLQCQEQSNLGVCGGWVWRYCSFSQPCKSSPTHTSRQSQNGEKTANLSLSQIHELLDYSFEHIAKTICTGFTLTGRRRIHKIHLWKYSNKWSIVHKMANGCFKNNGWFSVLKHTLHITRSIVQVVS